MNKPELLGRKDCYFFYNGETINILDETPVEEFFISERKTIIFNDSFYGGFGWSEEEIEELLLQEEKICPKIRTLPKPRPKKTIITIKFNNKKEIIEIKFSNYE